MSKGLLFLNELNELKKLSSLVIEQTTPATPFGRAASQLQKDRATGTQRPLDIGSSGQEKLQSYGEFAPGLGTALSGKEALQSFQQGNYGGAALAGAAALGSVLPGGGPAVKGAGKTLFNWLGKGREAERLAAQAAPTVTKPVPGQSREASKYLQQKAEQDKAFSSAASAGKKQEPTLNTDNISATGRPEPFISGNAPVKTAANQPITKSGNIDVVLPTRSPGGSVGTDITGAATSSNRAPSIRQMLDREPGPPVKSTSVGQQVNKPSTAQTQAPATDAAAELSKSATVAKPTLSTPKAVGAGLGLGGLGLAASYPDKTKEVIDQILGSTAAPAAPAASASSPAAPAASASSPAAPAASASSPAAPAPGRSSTPAAAASAPVVAPFGSGPPDTRLLINPPPAAPVTKAAPAPPADTNTGQIVTNVVNQARAETPFRISDQEQKQRELDREQTRAKAMDFLSKGNVGINPDAWTDKDKQNLAKMQGQGIQESIHELKKLSGLVK